MSTIVRSKARIRPFGGRPQEPLSARAVRVRNACVQRAAVHLGLPVPGDDELSALGSDASLARALEWWRGAHARHDVEVAVRPRAGRSRALIRAACATAVTLLALALSYGQAQ